MRPRRLPVDIAKLLLWLGIKARRRGTEWWACCPVHGEKEPSWQIHDSPDDDAHGLWRCFGCGAKGNALGLVADRFDVGWREALEMVQEQGLIGGPPPIPLRVEVVTERPRVRGCVLPPGVMFGPVDQWVSPARRYILSRGITPEQIDRWGIGYAVDGKLRGRLVFPVRDAHGRVVGYSARTFIDDEKRYLEPSTADGYELGAVYGEEHWPPVGQRPVVVVTEGAINALAVERAVDVCPEFGALAPPFGAVRGSNLQPGHLVRLGTFGVVLVASDPDKAGDKLFADLKQALGRWARVRRVGLEVNDCAATPIDELAGALGAAWLAG